MPIPAHLLLMSGGGQPFDPTDLGSLDAWFDASDSGTITESSGLVSQWDDKSGNARHLTSSGAARPTTGSATIGGLNAISTSSTTYMQKTSSGLATDDFTLYVVFVKTGSSASFEAAPVTMTSSNQGYPFDRYSNTTFGNQWIIASTGLTGYSDIRSQTTACQFCWRGDKDKGGTSGHHGCKEYKNGTLVSDQTNVGPTWNGNGTLGVGRRADGATTFTGDVGEILIYGAAHDDTARGQVEDYLSAKWGV